jgi:delta-aminolevulinic acid dehydratase/porphobilinogen synthase
MLRRVALVKTDVSEERSASFIRVTEIDELRKMLAVTSVVPSSLILVTLMKEGLSSSETSVLTRATRLTSHKTPFFIKKDILGRINCLLSFERTRTTQKTKIGEYKDTDTNVVI